MNTEMYEYITELQERCEQLSHTLRGALQALEAMPPDYLKSPYVHSRIEEIKKALTIT